MTTSRIYNRDKMNDLKSTTNKSIQYSRSQARDIFARMPAIEVVEYVTTGNKTDSAFVGSRGTKHAPAGHYVIVCSTGGKCGKCRRDYRPVS